MEIRKTAAAGTMESSDCMVTMEPNEDGIELELDSVVARQYGRRIREVVMETLERLDIRNVRISIIDKGALDCTIKARVEGAAARASEQEGKIDWGGVIR